MTEKIKAIIQSLARALPIQGPIYEFGSYQTKGQEGFADLRPLFPGIPYVGCDMRQGPGVDWVVDITKASLPENDAGAVLCLDMLEHCDDPWLAVREMRRFLREDGIAILSVPFNHPIHDHPSDYLRFTQEGLRLLLKDFAHVETGQSEEGVLPGSVAAVAWKEAPAPWEAGSARRILEDWPGLHVKRRRTLRSRVRDFVPVGLLNLVRAHYGERIL